MTANASTLPGAKGGARREGRGGEGRRPEYSAPQTDVPASLPAVRMLQRLQHTAAIVLLLGRAGRLHNAASVPGVNQSNWDTGGAE